MAMQSLLHTRMQRRRARTRASISLRSDLPRLSVHRTLRYMYAQIINDETGTTVAATSDLALKATGTKVEKAAQVGTEIAKLALAAGVTQVRFDRGSFQYHGRVASLAEAARTAGLKF
jgi:large subunit ribosomal protein L18